MNVFSIIIMMLQPIYFIRMIQQKKLGILAWEAQAEYKQTVCAPSYSLAAFILYLEPLKFVLKLFYMFNKIAYSQP